MEAVKEREHFASTFANVCFEIGSYFLLNRQMNRVTANKMRDLKVPSVTAGKFKLL